MEAVAGEELVQLTATPFLFFGPEQTVALQETRQRANQRPGHTICVPNGKWLSSESLSKMRLSQLYPLASNHFSSRTQRNVLNEGRQITKNLRDFLSTSVIEGGGARTHDLRIKSPLLYRLSYASASPRSLIPATSSAKPKTTSPSTAGTLLVYRESRKTFRVFLGKIRECPEEALVT